MSGLPQIPAKFTVSESSADEGWIVARDGCALWQVDYAKFHGPNAKKNAEQYAELQNLIDGASKHFAGLLPTKLQPLTNGELNALVEDDLAIGNTLQI